ncbi:hypothetical protein KIPB_003379 [Kipferlia bialata]|uniref:Uncharacterized protein n=1 Tax=Kipferlia bialata TaxID=797122 RepID=A0A9K3GGM0_9EUKA|nr:hypothetical protein KIPB_003379 [Kipferlia bialata]|eukprot:g3379.t1
MGTDTHRVHNDMEVYSDDDAPSPPVLYEFLIVDAFMQYDSRMRPSLICCMRIRTQGDSTTIGFRLGVVYGIESLAVRSQIHGMLEDGKHECYLLSPLVQASRADHDLIRTARLEWGQGKYRLSDTMPHFMFQQDTDSYELVVRATCPRPRKRPRHLVGQEGADSPVSPMLPTFAKRFSSNELRRIGNNSVEKKDGYTYLKEAIDTIHKCRQVNSHAKPEASFLAVVLDAALPRQKRANDDPYITMTLIDPFTVCLTDELARQEERAREEHEQKRDEAERAALLQREGGIATAAPRVDSPRTVREKERERQRELHARALEHREDPSSVPLMVRMTLFIKKKYPQIQHALPLLPGSIIRVHKASYTYFHKTGQNVLMCGGKVATSLVLPGVIAPKATWDPSLHHKAMRMHRRMAMVVQQWTSHTAIDRRLGIPADPYEYGTQTGDSPSAAIETLPCQLRNEVLLHESWTIRRLPVSHLPPTLSIPAMTSGQIYKADGNRLRDKATSMAIIGRLDGYTPTTEPTVHRHRRREGETESVEEKGSLACVTVDCMGIVPVFKTLVLADKGPTVYACPGDGTTLSLSLGGAFEKELETTRFTLFGKKYDAHATSFPALVPQMGDGGYTQDQILSEQDDSDEDESDLVDTTRPSTSSGVTLPEHGAPYVHQSGDIDYFQDSPHNWVYVQFCTANTEAGRPVIQISEESVEKMSILGDWHPDAIRARDIATVRSADRGAHLTGPTVSAGAPLGADAPLPSVTLAQAASTPGTVLPLTVTLKAPAVTVSHGSILTTSVTAVPAVVPNPMSPHATPDDVPVPIPPFPLHLSTGGGGLVPVTVSDTALSLPAYLPASILADLCGGPLKAVYSGSPSLSVPTDPDTPSLPSIHTALAREGHLHSTDRLELGTDHSYRFDLPSLGGMDIRGQGVFLQGPSSGTTGTCLVILQAEHMG